MFVSHSHSPQDTMALGAKIGALLRTGDVVNLNGTLGAGKTLLVKGMCERLGIPERAVTSPTFTLINEYQGRLPIYHFDVYRLERGSELEDIGYEEYFYGRGITLVEWGDLFPEYLPAERLDITIEQVDDTSRTIHVEGVGKRGSEITRKLKEVG